MLRQAQADRKRSCSTINLRHDLQRTVIVAVVAVGMMQVSIDQIVDMISVGHRLVTAIRSMAVSRVMPAAAMLGRTAIRVCRTDLDDVLIDVIVVRVMQMAVVQVVDVTVVPDCDVAAALAMDVRMIGVNGMIVCGHGSSPFLGFALQCDA